MLDFAEPSGNSYFNALAVALNQMCDGKRWYASTKELQPASLDLCIACRTCPTGHLQVGTRTPRRLLAAADLPKGRCCTRVPRVRARRVTWDLRTAAELRIPILAMTDTDCLEFGDDFNGSLEAVGWPRRLKTIEFCQVSPLNHPIDLVEWPASLQTLAFGQFFNQPIKGVCWPASLQNLNFGNEFNQAIEGVSWPDSLQTLTFGDRFNQSVEGCFMAR